MIRKDQGCTERKVLGDSRDWYRYGFLFSGKVTGVLGDMFFNTHNL